MKIVEGYKLSDCLNEVLFAVDQDGKVFSTTRLYSNSFYQVKDKWVEVKNLPKEIEFIGRYKLNI